jgi:ABC-type spermidine/putrescine transport system permease subunit II
MSRTDSTGLFKPWVSYLCIACGSVALVLLYGPILGLAVLSFSEQPLSGIPWPFTFRWYHALFTDDKAHWIEALGTSVLIGAIVALCSTAIAFAVAHELVRLRRTLPLLTTFLIVVTIPGTVMGIAILAFYRVMLSFRTGLWSIVLAHLSWALPFALMCVLIVLWRFDMTLLDAAEDLGATKWRRLIDIELPLLMPGISASAFFSFLLSFNELPRTIYVRGSTRTLPFYLWTQSTSHSSQSAFIYALGAIIMVVSFAIITIAMRSLSRNQT